MGFKNRLLVFAMLLLTLSFGLSQLVTTHRYTSISVTIRFDKNLRFTGVDIETTYSYTSENTAFAFNYTEFTSESENVTGHEWHILTIVLNGTSTYRWSSATLEIQSGGYLRYVFFDVQFGAYTLTATIQQLEFEGWEGEMLFVTARILDELKTEYVV